jgi:hypothetical protein
MPPAPTAAPASSPVNDTLFHPTGAATGTPLPTKRLTVRVSVKKLKHGKRRITVYGAAPAKAHLKIALRRGHKRALVRKRTTKLNAYRVKFTVRKRGKYRVRVSGRVGTTRLRAVARARRVR